MAKAADNTRGKEERRGSADPAEAQAAYLLAVARRDQWVQAYVTLCLYVPAPSGCGPDWQFELNSDQVTVQLIRITSGLRCGRVPHMIILLVAAYQDAAGSGPPARPAQPVLCTAVGLGNQSRMILHQTCLKARYDTSQWPCRGSGHGGHSSHGQGAVPGNSQCPLRR